jgi:membrane-anchored protein YejM (alkaline phosphatase superfamily)
LLTQSEKTLDYALDGASSNLAGTTLVASRPHRLSAKAKRTRSPLSHSSQAVRTTKHVSSGNRDQVAVTPLGPASLPL